MRILYRDRGSLVAWPTLTPHAKHASVYGDDGPGLNSFGTFKMFPKNCKEMLTSGHSIPTHIVKPSS